MTRSPSRVLRASRFHAQGAQCAPGFLDFDRVSRLVCRLDTAAFDAPSPRETGRRDIPPRVPDRWRLLISTLAEADKQNTHSIITRV
ncbi:hypothetical protein [Acetobacter conturbans]|uniref:Uncharacterized protein n=1 Tax=Acetobacter conturbans TaxID=1737472 RepID=A0ABX0K077_9PROT|nr:hypothetical protein [Acetobacter conturbans]NHN87665.1 hypothetical protein [Acetobacter conturbans]